MNIYAIKALYFGVGAVIGAGIAYADEKLSYKLKNKKENVNTDVSEPLDEYKSKLDELGYSMTEEEIAYKQWIEEQKKEETVQYNDAEMAAIESVMASYEHPTESDGDLPSNDEDENPYPDVSKSDEEKFYDPEDDTYDGHISEKPTYDPPIDEHDPDYVEIKSRFPYIVDEDLFNESTYTKRCLELYANNVLIDDDGEIIRAPFKLLGGSAINELKKGVYVGETNIYVLNDVLQTAYDISYVDENYIDPEYDDTV